MSNTRRPTLILAEDHAEVAAAFRRLLSEEFDVVDVVADGETLVTRALELRPDVILTDFSLHGLDGISATIELRHQYPLLPIVVMSAHDDPALGPAALAAGASAFVSKVEAARSIVGIFNNLLRAPDPHRYGRTASSS